jgi:hypothetical protein
MAGFHSLQDLELDDDQKFDLKQQMKAGYEPPDYPMGVRFTVCEPDFEALGIDAPRPEQMISFSMIGECMSANRSIGSCRMELEIVFLSLGDGEMCEMTCRPCLCLDEMVHERLDLDEDSAERGGVLHLIGMARVEETNDPSFGQQSVTLQVVSASCEDEGAETAESM